jgi:hypothetical protein
MKRMDPKPIQNDSWSRPQSGAAVLPIIIGVAVAITLLQVPLLFKTKSGNSFSGAQKSNITAKEMAEAGIDAVISDIGRKAILVRSTTDTLPYAGVTLGRGSYSAQVKTYQLNPDRIKVVSSGTIGGKSQSIEAKMELVKTETTIPYDTPKMALWGIRGSPATLYYQSLAERDSGWAWIHPEGQVSLSDGDQVNTDDFTVAPNGMMYFINNVAGNPSKLYKIRPMDLDNNPATPVTAILIGPIINNMNPALDFGVGTPREIRGLVFVSRTNTAANGVLYAVTWQSMEVWELNLRDGGASIVDTIIPKPMPAGGFSVDAFAQDMAGKFYVVRNNNNNNKSELWVFDEFETSPSSPRKDTVLLAANISNRNARALAGHPNGYMYAADDQKWYRINPNVNNPSNATDILFSDNSAYRGMGFYYEREDLKFTGTPLKHKINICHYPPGNCANVQTIQIDSSALNGHLNHGGTCPSDLSGYCGGIADSIAYVADTTIQLRVISWREIPGNALPSQNAGH